MVKNHNLTARSFGSLIGRDQFIIDVLDALKDNFSLVSIEGYSGIGKTSLAKEVAYRCIEANRNEVEVPPCFDYIVWIDTPKNPTSTWINEIFDQIATVTGHLSIKGTLRDRIAIQQPKEIQ